MDKIVADVAAMGFSPQQVQAVIQQLTSTGQNVDLNVVLDKLMNGPSGPGRGAAPSPPMQHGQWYR